MNAERCAAAAKHRNPHPREIALTTGGIENMHVISSLSHVSIMRCLCPICDLLPNEFVCGMYYTFNPETCPSWIIIWNIVADTLLIVADTLLILADSSEAQRTSFQRANIYLRCKLWWGMTLIGKWEYARRMIFLNLSIVAATCQSSSSFRDDCAVTLAASCTACWQSAIAPSWGICTRRTGKLYKARHRLYGCIEADFCK